MRRWSKRVLLPVSAAALLTTPLSATVLNFVLADVDGMASGVGAHDDYGDRATGDGVPNADYAYGPLGSTNWTPNVEVDYTTGKTPPANRRPSRRWRGTTRVTVRTRSPTARRPS